MVQRIRFEVSVPFEPVEHHTLDTSVAAALPEGELMDGLSVTRGGGHYVARVEVISDHPRSAKEAAIRRAEDLLRLLAAWNDGFKVRFRDVSARQISTLDNEAEPVLAESDRRAFARADYGFAENHASVLKVKDSYIKERAWLQWLAELPAYVHDALELNYLVTTSDRPHTRFVLALTALEGLATGRLGSQPLIRDSLNEDQREVLRDRLRLCLVDLGLEPDPADRVV
jgi:hypothetical protein